MTLDRTHLITFIAGAIVGLVAGFFICKGIYDRPIKESVTRDTTTTIDTIPDIAPEPKDSTPVRTIIRYLPAVRDGISQYQDGTARCDTASRVDLFREATQKVDHIADTSKMIAVEVPITSKHYHAEEYDAWVSGYEPSLDSIKVYRETQYIKETVTKSKSPNRVTVGLQAGYGYGFKAKQLEPYVGIGIGIRIF